MVEFIRDVVIVLAVLITLMAVALNPNAETEGPKKTLDQRTSLVNVPGPAPSQAEPIIAPAPAPQPSQY